MSSKKKLVKAPPKLSPQEEGVLGGLLAMRNRQAHVDFLYRQARGLKVSEIAGTEPRKMQQHVGVVVQRLNRKRQRFIIKPGDKPRTYKLARRR